MGTNTVGWVKLQVEGRYGIPSHCQSLILRNDVLEDDVVELRALLPSASWSSSPSLVRLYLTLVSSLSLTADDVLESVLNAGSFSEADTFLSVVQPCDRLNHHVVEEVVKLLRGALDGHDVVQRSFVLGGRSKLLADKQFSAKLVVKDAAFLGVVKEDLRQDKGLVLEALRVYPDLYFTCEPKLCAEILKDVDVVSVVLPEHPVRMLANCPKEVACNASVALEVLQAVSDRSPNGKLQEFPEVFRTLQERGSALLSDGDFILDVVKTWSSVSFDFMLPRLHEKLLDDEQFMLALLELGVSCYPHACV